MLTAKRDNSRELELQPSEGWESEGTNLLLSRFQQGTMSAPELCAQLLISSATQDEEGSREISEPLVIE